MFEIGFMQGRAGPKYLGKYQAHPVGNWSHEFEFAQDSNFSCIEFIVDLDEWESNPLFSPDGIKKIQDKILKTDVSVRSICADCFMDLPFHSSDAKTRKLANEMLSRLIESSVKINSEVIVVPCVDRSSLRSRDEAEVLVSELKNRVSELENFNVKLSLETDWPAEEFASLLKKLPEAIGANYDIGNSASLGYDLSKEFDAYGERINDIHIKDRLKGGGSVFLGTGSADFNHALAAIKEINFTGPLIMQAFRDNLGTKVLLEQLGYLRKLGW